MPSATSPSESISIDELQPWKKKSWCIAKPSAQYVAKMEDVLEVYARPYSPQRPVICLDDKSKELHDTPRGALSPGSGQHPANGGGR